jgi:hypothetical protein
LGRSPAGRSDPLLAGKKSMRKILDSVGGNCIKHFIDQIRRFFLSMGFNIKVGKDHKIRRPV